MKKELICTLDEFLARYFPATDELEGDFDDPDRAGWLMAEKAFRKAESGNTNHRSER